MDLDLSTPTPPRRASRPNPFLRALVIIGAAALLFAFVLSGVASNSSNDAATAAVMGSVAGSLLQLGVLSILLALAAAAIRWTPTPPAEAPTRPVDTSGMTDGEARFFSET